jgi:chromosome partitioning protein
MRLTIGCLKGGTGKTTSAVFLAAALAQDGPTLLVDADPQSQSAYDWSQLAVDRGDLLPYEVQPWATTDLARKVRGVADRYAHVVIDVGGENPAMFRAAASVTGELLVPVSPSEAELRRIPATFAAAAEVENMTGVEVYPRILLVKVDSRTGDGPAAREFLQASDLPVMAAQVRDAVLYPRSYGHVPADPGDYAAVLAELLAEVPA